MVKLDKNITATCQDKDHKNCMGWDIKENALLIKYGGTQHPPKMVRSKCMCPCHKRVYN